jgi:hypothetical protein
MKRLEPAHQPLRSVSSTFRYDGFEGDEKKKRSKSLHEKKEDFRAVFTSAKTNHS